MFTVDTFAVIFHFYLKKVFGWVKADLDGDRVICVAQGIRKEILEHLLKAHLVALNIHG